MRVVAALAVLVLGGGCALEPVARFAPRDHAECGVGAVGSDSFAVRFGDDIIVVTSAESRRLAGVCAGVPERRQFVAISGDGGVVVWSGFAKGVRMRETAAGKTTQLSPDWDAPWWVGTIPPFALAVSADGARVALASDHAETSVLSRPELRAVATFPFEATWLGLSHDGSRIACGMRKSGAPDELLVFDVSTGARVLLAHVAAGYGAQDGVFSPDGCELVFGAAGLAFELGRPGAKRFQDLGDVFVEGEGFPRFNGMHHALALGSEGRVFAGEDDGTVVVFDRHLGKEVARFQVLSNTVSLVLLSRDESRLLVGAGSTLALLDARTGELLRAVVPPSSPVEKIVFQEGALLVTHEDSAVCVVDRRSGEVRRVLPREPSAEATPEPVLSPDHSLEARSISLTDYAVFRAGSLEPLWSDSGAKVVAFSPDSKLLAVSGAELAVRDARSGETLARLGGVDPYYVTALAFSPDGRELACGCHDGAVVVYALPLR